MRVRVKNFAAVAAAVAEEDVELAKRLKQMVKMIHKSLLIKVKQVMAQPIKDDAGAGRVVKV